MTTAIILAGGLGTRLRSALPDLPKPMAPINGRPFLEHLIDYWITQGINRFVISVGYRKEDIQSHFGDWYHGFAVEYVLEDVPLGTGGGLLKAIGLVKQNEDVLVLNGDTFFEVDFQQLKAFHKKNNSRWTFSLFRANEAGRYMGMSVNQIGLITSLKSGTKELGQLANGGVYLIDPKVVGMTGISPGDKASLEDDILAELMVQNIPLYGYEFNGRFIDIGVPEDYMRASSVLA
jgi:D-glycero-alpha-D-manno-heptose 1-phosphate guanylyltransferase